MKYCTLLFVVLICNGTLGAQTLNLKIVNAQTQEAIPYAAVFSKDNKEGSYADEQGRFSFEFGAGVDTILFSAVGFSLEKMSLKQALGSKILALTPIVVNLPDVTVTSKDAKIGARNLGYFKKKGNKMFFSTNQHNRIALLIKNPLEQNAWVSKLQFQFSGWGDDVVKIYRLKLRIYANNEGTPGSDLWSHEGWLDLDSQQNKLEHAIPSRTLPLPAEGVFIGFDFLGYVDKKGTYHPFVKGQLMKQKSSSYPNVMAPKMRVLKDEKGMIVFNANGLGAWQRSSVEQFGAPMFGIVASFKE
jgi:hypothetical protein